MSSGIDLISNLGGILPALIGLVMQKRQGDQLMGMSQEMFDLYGTAHEQARTANQERYETMLYGSPAQEAQEAVYDDDGKLVTPERRATPAVGGYFDRMNELTAGYKSREQDFMNYGKQELADIRQNYGTMVSKGSQDMVSRGLAGTSLPSSMKARAQRQVTAEEGRLHSRIAAGRAGLQGESLSAQGNMWQQMLGAMERRTDKYPDPGLYLGLAKQYGSGFGSYGM